MSGIGQTVVDVVVTLAASSYAALGAPLKHEPRVQHPRPPVVEVRRLPVQRQPSPISVRQRAERVQVACRREDARRV